MTREPLYMPAVQRRRFTPFAIMVTIGQVITLIVSLVLVYVYYGVFNPL